MKKTLLFALLAIFSLTFMSCKTSDTKGECRIHGLAESSLNGKKVFLVPMEGPQDAAHVDSVVIKDGKFEFKKDTVQMSVIRVDYHYRDGIQELLVVTEPGDLTVFIGGNSTSNGTPQNDSLQSLKTLMEKGNRDFYLLKKNGADAEQIRKYQEQFKNSISEFAKRQPEGMVKTFLSKMYAIK